CSGSQPIALISIGLYRRTLFTIRQYLVDLVVRQVFVKIEPDLHHRCGTAAAEAFDHGYSEFSVLCGLAGMYPEFRTNMISYRGLAHDLARQRLAYLDVVPADRTQIEHRVERRCFPDVRHLN